MIRLTEDSKLSFDSSEGSAQTHIESLLLTEQRVSGSRIYCS